MDTHFTPAMPSHEDHRAWPRLSHVLHAAEQFPTSFRRGTQRLLLRVALMWLSISIGWAAFRVAREARTARR